MALTKDVQEFIGIVHNGVLEYRRTVRAFDDDGSVIGERHNRTTFVPTDTIANLPTQRLRRVATAVWTQEVIDAYIAAQGQGL